MIPCRGFSKFRASLKFPLQSGNKIWPLRKMNHGTQKLLTANHNGVRLSFQQAGADG